MRTPLPLSKNADKFLHLLGADPVLNYLIAEKDSYEGAVEELSELDNDEPTPENKEKTTKLEKEFAKMKKPLLDNITIDNDVDAQAAFKALRPTLLRFASIDSGLPSAPNGKKMDELKMRVEIVNSIREQPEGNPILAAFDKHGARGVAERYPAVYGSRELDR